MLKLSIIIPVRNEGINLPVMLRVLSAAVDVPHEVLVVHDDLDDDSVPAVQALQPRLPQVRVMHNTLGRGATNAVKTGLAAASGEYVLVIPADDMGPIVVIDGMMRLMDRGCDLVSMTRYAWGGRRFGGSRLGGILSWTANWIFHHVGGMVLTDATTGGKMFRRGLFERLEIRCETAGWGFALEMAIKAQAAGLQLGEVPVTSIDRFYGGKSTFEVGSWILGYGRWFFRGLRELRRAPRPPRPILLG